MTDAADLPSSSPTLRRARWFDPTAFATLVGMTIERLARGKRLLAVCALFFLPAGIALLARVYHEDALPPEAEETLIFYMIPQALVPLTALVLAAGMIQDEVEDQTLTYLFMSPVPRWLIYLAKLLGAILVAAGAAVVFTTLALAAIHAGAPNFRPDIVPIRAAKVAALFTLASVVYAAAFGLLSLVVRKSLVIGVVYIVMFEGLLANIDFVARRLTVIYYVRVLAERWLDLHIASWSLDLEAAPSGPTALWYLLGAAAVCAAAAGVVVSLREFRLKTPEGN